MSTIALLAALITTPALQPEPVQFDHEVINQEVQAQLQDQLAEVRQSMFNMEVGPSVQVAKVDSDEHDAE
ncbi:hypothetical protein [Ferrimonas balearica]|uniref:hypothetical protein n=1 Tax=Ferrimonas balearica TaxID=44012 RepID=UPI001C998EC4|nr:hypothetical protein [Ferrimonas balearica]MBY5992750.1 hypothetical protein [Ferrimonas balearica]